MHVLGKRLLIITAHPDDESYLAAGVMLKNAAAGGNNFVFCATRGERGKAHLKKECSSAELKRIRRRELMRVSKFLRVSKCQCNTFPDGGVSRKEFAATIRRKLGAFAAAVKPGIVLGFGKDGISGHMDHITMGRAAEALAKKLRIPYLAFCMPPELQGTRGIQSLLRRRAHGVYAKRHRALESADIIVPIDGVKKLRALKMHASQLEKGDPFHNIPKAAARAWLRAEYFAMHAPYTQHTSRQHGGVRVR
jgi:LmbE family N-acetylglucosaminyl deacetylase